MSSQRARSALTADHRSAHPNIPGVPWWGAVLIAVTMTAIGFAYDAGSGSKELSMVFAASYAIGCLMAALAVRQAAIFTAVIQPPLLLFVSVPTAYLLFSGGQLTGIKDTLINCGYPLIERFPLMFFTSAAVLLIGMARWYQGMSARRAAPRSTTTDTTKDATTSSSLASKVASLFKPEPDSEDPVEAAESPGRTRTADASSRKPTKRAAPSRSRHARPPETEIIEPVPDRPRRPAKRHGEPPPAAEPRRRPRASSPPRQAVPPPPDRRTGYERPERRRRFDDYQPLEPHGSNGTGTHHPISRVRYRGGEDDVDRADHRTRRRTPRDRESERWEYDA